MKTEDNKCKEGGSWHESNCKHNKKVPMIPCPHCGDKYPYLKYPKECIEAIINKNGKQ